MGLLTQTTVFGQDSLAGTYAFYSVERYSHGYNAESGSSYWEELPRPDTTLASVYMLKSDGTFVRQEWGSSTYTFVGMKERGMTFEVAGTWKMVDGILLIILEREKVFEDRKMTRLLAENDLTKKPIGTSPQQNKMYEEVFWPKRYIPFKWMENGELCEAANSELRFCYHKIIK
jgi:hypothetical protein